MNQYKSLFLTSCMSIGAVLANQMESQSSLGNLLEEAMVHCYAINDKNTEGYADMIFFLWCSIMLQEHFEHVNKKQSPPLSEQEVAHSLQVLSDTVLQATDQCFEQLREPVIDWPEQGVRLERARPICYRLRELLAEIEQYREQRNHAKLPVSAFSE